MISTSITRHGLIVVAATVNDNRDVTTAIGVTAEHATRRLFKALS